MLVTFGVGAGSAQSTTIHPPPPGEFLVGKAGQGRVSSIIARTATAPAPAPPSSLSMGSQCGIVVCTRSIRGQDQDQGQGKGQGKGEAFPLLLAQHRYPLQSSHTDPKEGLAVSHVEAHIRPARDYSNKNSNVHSHNLRDRAPKKSSSTHPTRLLQRLRYASLHSYYDEWVPQVTEGCHPGPKQTEMLPSSFIARCGTLLFALGCPSTRDEPILEH